MWSSEDVTDFSTLVGYYVNLDSYQASDPTTDKVLHHTDLSNMIKAAKELGIISKGSRVYGLRARNRKRQSKEGNLVDLLPLCSEYYKGKPPMKKTNWGDDETIVERMKNSDDLNTIITDKMLMADSPALEMIKYIDDANQCSRSFHVKQLINTLVDFGYLTSEVIDKNELNTTVRTRYPILALIYSFNRWDSIRYINQMDKLFQYESKDITDEIK